MEENILYTYTRDGVNLSTPSLKLAFLRTDTVVFECQPGKDPVEIIFKINPSFN